MDKLSQKIQKLEDDHYEGVVQEHVDRHAQRLREEALLISGGLKASSRIADAINSEVMVGLIRFQDEKRHEDLGFPRFVDYLDSDLSPISKHAFYERKPLFEKEGPALFDLYAANGLPKKTRKLLAAGTVEIDGENLVIHNGDETQVVTINDRTVWIESLTALAEANAEKSAKIEKQNEKIERHDAEKRELYNENDRLRASKAAEIEGDPHSMALVAVIGAFKNLREEIASLSPVDRGARRDNVLELLAGQMQLTAESYGSADWTRHAPRPERSAGLDPEDEYIEGLIDRVFEDEGGGNDAELAAAMG